MDAAGGISGDNRPTPKLQAVGTGGNQPPAHSHRISNPNPTRTTRCMPSASTLKRKRSDDEASIPIQPRMHTFPSTGLDTTYNADSIDSDESLLEDDAVMEADADADSDDIGLPNAMISKHLEPSDAWDKTMPAAMPAAAPPPLPNERSLPDGPDGPMALPATKVFPIQVGPKLFSLSGASLSSDAPSYFTRFFGAQLDAGADVAIKTLYLDRDPDTFTDISLHLQGYHVEPRDGLQFVRLFADAQFFNLPRLIQRLYKSDIFVRVGDREFKIARDLLDGPGDSPNYFNLGFGVFFHTPENMFPGLRMDALLRPPAMKAPCIEGRSPAIFEDLLKVLQGYEGVVRDEAHREAMLRDARYYHLRGLEQKLLACRIEWNAFLRREEIILRLQDLKPAGLGIELQAGLAHLKYARPHVDQTHRHLVISVPERTAYMDTSNKEAPVLVFAPAMKARIISLHRLLVSKWREATKDDTRHLPQDKAERPRAGFGLQSHITVNGLRLLEDGEPELADAPTWALGKSMWSVSVRSGKDADLEVVWQAVKVEAWTEEQKSNGAREWL